MIIIHQPSLLRRVERFLSVLMFVAQPMLGQRDANPVAAVGGCAFCSSILLIPVILFVLNLALLVWVARDAKSRGMDSSVLWMLLVMFTSIIGFAIYIFARPQGNVIQCSNCSNKRLQAILKCPHCGSGQGVIGPNPI
jgi:uncharacterized membrane protein YhaH (DUF805 family)